MSMDTYGDRRRNKDPFPTPPTPDPRERVNYAAMMAARDENERDAARVVDAYLADHGVRWSPGAAQMAADLLALEALRAPAPSEAVAWLIEKPQPGGVYWWHGKRHALAAINEDYNPDHFPSAIAYEFGPVAAEAVRFNSREDADVVIRRFPPQWRSVLIASEHMWVSALPAPAPSEAVDERIVRHPNGHLMVERVPAWVPTEEQTSEALQSLGKAWPYLADHAPHMDGEFNIAHRNLTRYVERFRELLAAQRESAPSEAVATQRCPTCGCDGQSAVSHWHTHPAPARGVTVTEAMVERAMGVECGSTHHEHHPPDCRRCWQAKLTAALTPDAEGGA